MRQLLAAWMVVTEQDIPMNPRLIGKPGVGKTTLAYAAAKAALSTNRWGLTGWKVMSELPNPVNFEAATTTVREEDMIAQFACGPVAATGSARCSVAINVNVAPIADAQTPASLIPGYHPADLASAYGFPIQNPGRTVAIVDAFHDIMNQRLCATLIPR